MPESDPARQHPHQSTREKLRTTAGFWLLIAPGLVVFLVLSGVLAVLEWGHRVATSDPVHAGAAGLVERSQTIPWPPRPFGGEDGGE